jgi:hypothetical protein
MGIDTAGKMGEASKMANDFQLREFGESGRIFPEKCGRDFPLYRQRVAPGRRDPLRSTTGFFPESQFHGRTLHNCPFAFNHTL